MTVFVSATTLLLRHEHPFPSNSQETSLWRNLSLFVVAWSAIR
jgi:hypothetical protein